VCLHLLAGPLLWVPKQNLTASIPKGRTLKEMEAQGFISLSSLVRLLGKFDKLGPVQPTEVL